MQPNELSVDPECWEIACAGQAGLSDFGAATRNDAPAFRATPVGCSRFGDELWGSVARAIGGREGKCGCHS
jgi:hypothetical protein